MLQPTLDSFELRTWRLIVLNLASSHDRPQTWQPTLDSFKLGILHIPVHKLGSPHLIVLNLAAYTYPSINLAAYTWPSQNVASSHDRPKMLQPTLDSYKKIVLNTHSCRFTFIFFRCYISFALSIILRLFHNKSLAQNPAVSSVFGSCICLSKYRFFLKES
jgi:hypothetical protein